MLVIGPPSRPLSGEIASWETLGRSAARVARPTPGPQNAVQSDSLGELQAHFARPPHALWLVSLSLCSSGCGCDPPCTGLSLPSTTYIKHTPIRANLFRMPEARSPSDTEDSRLLLLGNQFDPDPRQVGQQFLGNRTDGVTACNPASTSFGRTARRIPATPEMADEGLRQPISDAPSEKRPSNCVARDSDRNHPRAIVVPRSRSRRRAELTLEDPRHAPGTHPSHCHFSRRKCRSDSTVTNTSSLSKWTPGLRKTPKAKQRRPRKQRNGNPSTQAKQVHCRPPRLRNRGPLRN